METLLPCFETLGSTNLSRPVKLHSSILPWEAVCHRLFPASWSDVTMTTTTKITTTKTWMFDPSYEKSSDVDLSDFFFGFYMLLVFVWDHKMNLLLLVQGVIVLHSDGVVIALLLYTRSTCLSIISLTCRLMKTLCLFFVGFFGAETINNRWNVFFHCQEVEKHLGKEAWVPQIWKLLVCCTGKGSQGKKL